MDSLYSVLKNTCEQYPNRKAMTFYGRRIKFHKLLSYVDCFAYKLKYYYNINKGDVVTVCMPNAPSATIALYAVNKIGAICNLVHPFVPVEQLRRECNRTNTKLLIIYDVYTLKNDCHQLDGSILLSDCGYFMGKLAKLYFHRTNKGIKYNFFKSLEKCFVGYYEKFAEYQFDQNEDAIYLPSGGTTGQPKIIRHSVQSFNQLCSYAQFYMSKPVPEYKAMYSVLPIFHGFGLCMNTHMCIMFGMNNVMSIKFNAKHMARSIIKEKVGVLTGVPTMYARLLREKAFYKGNLSSLVECFVGGDTLSTQLANEFDTVLKRQGSQGKLLAGYGLTETIAVCAVNRINDNREQSIGHAVPNAEFLIVKDGKILPCGEVGEILVHSPVMMLGYFGDEQSSIKPFNGKDYLYTGDYGYLDSDGYLYFKQRLKNIIKVNGMTVFPNEIEEVVSSIDGVKNCVAIAMPDIKRGQSVKLCVELIDNSHKDNIVQAIKQQCAKQLIVYAQPREIVVLDSMPLSQLGKVDRLLLEKQLNG